MNEGQPTPIPSAIVIAAHSALDTNVHGVGAGKIAGTETANTFLAPQVVRATAAQDGIELLGRAGGTSSFLATLTPPVLAANITITLPAATSTLATLGQNLFTAPQSIDLGSGASSLTPAASGFLIRGADGVQTGFVTESYGASPVFDWHMADGTRAAPAVIANTRQLLALRGWGWTAANTWSFGGGLDLNADGAWVSGVNHGTYLRFRIVANGSTSAAEKMRIDGIGLKLANSIGVNGATPPAQATGFGTPTNLGRVSGFPGTSATLAQCGGAISDLITYLKSMGILGA